MTDDTRDGHVDLDVLAEVDEGIAGPDVAAATREHLERCAECRDRMAHLRTTRALLSTLPPMSMPELVQAQVSEALQRAALQPSGTVVPIGRPRRSWNSPAVAGAAAAAAVVVLVGALVAGNVLHRSGKSSSTATAPLAADGTHRGAAGSTATTKEWATGTDYSPANIPALVPRLVTGTPPSTASGTLYGGNEGAQKSVPAPSALSAAPTDAVTQSSMRTDPRAVLACGTILAGGVQTVPVAVDFASYAGKPAVIFVLPAVGHPDQLDVWVVRSACSASSLDVYFRRIPRPAG